MVSENSIQINSQQNQHDVSLDSAGNSILAQGLSQARQYAKKKPRFVEFACSHTEVSATSSYSRKGDAYDFVAGIPLCVVDHKNRYSKAILGEQEEFQPRSALLAPFIWLLCGPSC